VKALLKRAADIDPETQEALAAIAAFDELLASEASLDELTQQAARISARRVVVVDSLNHRSAAASPVVAGAASSEPFFDRGAALTAIVALGVRARQAAAVATEEGELLATTVESGGGRIGSAWLEGGSARWTILDHLVTERLAAATAIDAHHVYRERRRRQDGSTAAEILLAATPSVDEVRMLARRLHLRPDDVYLVVAADCVPAGAASPEVVAEVVRTALGATGQELTALLTLPALIVDATESLEQVGLRLRDEEKTRGFAIAIGAGEPALPGELGRSWRQAREALSLASIFGFNGPVARFADFGCLPLLMRIPADDLIAQSEIQAVDALDGGAGVSDRLILETYCELQSLRQTASALHLHHSSVAYRLKQIEGRLDLDLSRPAACFRALLAVKLARIQHEYAS
jgi:hypothetical protein